MSKYNLISYTEEKEPTALQIKKILFNFKNQAAISEYSLGSPSDTLTINDKPISENLIASILTAYHDTSFVDLSKETITEDILLNRVQDGMRVEVKNGFDIYTFELGQENIFCTINADEEHAYYMKSSYEDFGRMKGGVEPKYKSFKDLIDLALTKAPSKLDLLLSNVDENLNALADKLDAPETAEIINQYLQKMSVFHNYSFNNQMLLAITAEKRGMNLERVASFNTWKKLHDSEGNAASVGKGEAGLPIVTPVEYKKYQRDKKGNYILQGGKKIPLIDSKTGKPETGLKFTAGFVFDINQLSNSQSIKKTLELEYRDSSVDIEDSVVDNLIKDISYKYNVSIHYEDIASGAKGYYSPAKNEIALSNRIDSNAAKISTLLHELGHKIMHSDLDYEEIHNNRGAIEGEAESFSMVLSNLYGISNNSNLYISTWKNTGDDLRKKLERISAVAKEAIKTLGLDRLQKSFSEITKAQEQEIAQNQAQSPVIKITEQKIRKPIEAVAELAKISSIATPKKNLGGLDVAI